jgi:hypothetical protein
VTIKLEGKYMSIEALWYVNFGSNQEAFGAGVAVFETGRIFGGDSSFYYKGNYEIKNSTITAEVFVKKHSEGLDSIFENLSEFNIVLEGPLEGSLNGNKFILAGYLKEDPAQKLASSFVRLDDLP